MHDSHGSEVTSSRDLSRSGSSLRRALRDTPRPPHLLSAHAVSPMPYQSDTPRSPPRTNRTRRISRHALDALHAANEQKKSNDASEIRAAHMPLPRARRQRAHAPRAADGRAPRSSAPRASRPPGLSRLARAQPASLAGAPRPVSAAPCPPRRSAGVPKTAAPWGCRPLRSTSPCRTRPRSARSDAPHARCVQLGLSLSEHMLLFLSFFHSFIFPF
jgi:hypothetical protein